MSATGNLTFYPGRVESIDFAGSTPYITFSLLVQNTASVRVVINSLAGNLFGGSDGTTLIGNVFEGEPVSVPANGQAVATLTAQLGILGIVNEIIRAFQYQNFQQKISFQGSANVGGVQAPLNLQFTIGA